MSYDAFKTGELLLVLEQEGGCDYTIGCDVAVIPVASYAETVKKIEEYAEEHADETTSVVRATLLTVTLDMTTSVGVAREEILQREREATRRPSSVFLRYKREEKRRVIAMLKKELEET